MTTPRAPQEEAISFSRGLIEQDLRGMPLTYRRALLVALRDVLRGGEVGVPIADVAGVQVLTLGLAGPEEMEQLRILYAVGEQGLRILSADAVSDVEVVQAAADQVAAEQEAAHEAEAEVLAGIRAVVAQQIADVGAAAAQEAILQDQHQVHQVPTFAVSPEQEVT